MQTLKKTILVDLDGVLNEYKGNYSENIIPPIKKGAKNFLKQLSSNYTLKLFTTRNKLLVSKWLITNSIDKYINDITNIKEVCWLFIDDRTIKFKGNYISLLNEIENFKPWYK